MQIMMIWIIFSCFVDGAPAYVRCYYADEVEDNENTSSNQKGRIDDLLYWVTTEIGK